MTSIEIERLESPTLREEVFQVRLPSGLQVYLCPKPGFQKKYACYSTFYGSVDNDFLVAGGERTRVPDGIAHFLEHTLFETEEGNVSDLFAANGAYNNASTSFTTTTYLFAASDRFFDNLKLLLSFVETPAFREEKVEKERGIIEQEIKGYDDSVDWVIYRTTLENLFQRHPIRIDIAGTAESIAGIDVPTLEACYRSFYHPANMSLFAVGDIDRSEFFDCVLGASRRSVPGGCVSERFFPDEPEEVACAHRRLSMEVAVPKILAGFKETRVPILGEAYVQRELVSEMALEICFGRSTDTFRELYERQLILDDFSASYSAGAGIGYALVGGDTPDPDRLEKILLERLSELRDHPLPPADFEREKRKFIGTFIRSFNSLEYLAANYTYFRFHGYDLFRTIDLLSRVTREMVLDRIRDLLEPERMSIAVVVPGR
ncbi:MAG: insulinase family protein [Planctomycetes bacterium]|nr:insulinase family protein [Planctomycetota bacterium]